MLKDECMILKSQALGVIRLILVINVVFYKGEKNYKFVKGSDKYLGEIYR